MHNTWYALLTMYMDVACALAFVVVVVSVGRAASDTSPEKNYAVEIPPKEYSPGITALQGLAQCKSLLPLGSPVMLTTGKPPPGKYTENSNNRSGLNTLFPLVSCFSSHEMNKMKLHLPIHEFFRRKRTPHTPRAEPHFFLTLF